MATIQDLRALALQIRDADEDRENTALKVGQFLCDLLGYLDTKADLTPRGPWSKQLSFSQTPIVALQSVEAIPDSQGQNNKMWWSSDDGKLKWKANDEVYPLGNPTYILYYCGNKIYRWGGSSTGFTKMEASGGASSITAFTSYVVKNSTSELPSSGNPATGYIVGTHIYAYVGSHGDTADGKYQDLGELNAAGVSLTTNGDGTFTVHAGGNDYTVNLNHTHENMAKLIVCEESDLPSTLDPATIYAQVDDADNPTEIETLYIAGLEFAGGGVPAGTPAITKPSGTTINLGTNYGSGVSEQVEIKGRDLTGDLTVTVGAGLTISYGQTLDGSSVTIPLANALAGALVTVAYSGSDALDDGSLVISGGGATPKSVVVVVVVEMREIDLTQNNVNAWIGADGKWSSGSTSEPQKSAIIDASGLTKIKITTAVGKTAIFLFLKSDPSSLFPVSSNVAYSTYLCTGETGRRVQTADTTETYTIPSDCVKVMIGLISNGANPGPQFTPQYVGVI